MGISKRELMEDYYVDELVVVMREHTKLHSAGTDGDDNSNASSGASMEQQDALDFFGM